MHSLCLVKAKKPRPYCPDHDYSLITDEYPKYILHIESEDDFWIEYTFSWYHFHPEPDYWCDSETWYDFDGHTYWCVDRGLMESTPIQCPTPSLPPLQGPPPPSQLCWEYPGYPMD